MAPAGLLAGSWLRLFGTGSRRGCPISGAAPLRWPEHCARLRSMLRRRALQRGCGAVPASPRGLVPRGTVWVRGWAPAVTPYLLLVAVAAVCSLGYLLVVLLSVPGALEERLAALEPPPAPLGQWLPDTESREGRQASERGLTLERRLLSEPSRWLGSGAWVHQTRLRNSRGQVVSVGPEVRVRRRRASRPRSNPPPAGR